MNLALSGGEAATVLNAIWCVYRRTVTQNGETAMEISNDIQPIALGVVYDRPIILEEEATGTTATAYPNQYYSLTSTQTGSTTTPTSTEYIYSGSTLCSGELQIYCNHEEW